MSTKYVLQTDGSIKKIETNEESQTTTTEFSGGNINILSKTIVKQSQEEEHYTYNSFAKENTIISVELDNLGDNETVNNILINKTSPNKNFGNPDSFIDERPSDVPEFKSFNSFTDYIDQDQENQTSVFASEIELLGGHTYLGEIDPRRSFRYLYFLDYIIEVTALIAIVEVASVASKLTYEKARKTNIDFSLVLGSYTFNTVDFISPYFLKVLNYPIKKSNTNDRLASFFIGLEAFLSGDEIIDIRDEIGNTLVGKTDGTLRTLASILFQNLAGVLQSSARTNLIDLIIRKFQMEKYWHDEHLYRAKPLTSNSYERYMSQFQYYYFKFAVERMHVGLNILNYKYKGLRGINNPGSESPFTRVGRSKLGNDSIEKVKIFDKYKYENTEQKYRWNPKVGIKSNNQSIRNRALPQAFQLPVSFIANKILNKSKEELEAGINIMAVDPSLSQNFVLNKTNRIDSKIILDLERRLELEYVPFYFHDIRTNEIISFHAFIDNLTDSFSPEYNSTAGFGRIDDVKNYVKTTRSIQLSFSLVSTSKEDHDLMWYQVNKLVSMCYPQWSEGLSASVKNKLNETTLFEYPFSQMPTASPMIRLRVGDVIKSNYSKQEFSRLHGIGNRKGIDEKLRDVIFNDGDLGAAITEGLNNLRKSLVDYIEALKALNKSDREKLIVLEKEITLTNVGIKSLWNEIRKEKLAYDEFLFMQDMHDVLIAYDDSFGNVEDGFVSRKRWNEEQRKKEKYQYDSAIQNIKYEINDLKKRQYELKEDKNLLTSEINKNKKEFGIASDIAVKEEKFNESKYCVLQPGVYKKKKDGVFLGFGEEDSYIPIKKHTSVEIVEDVGEYYKVSYAALNPSDLDSNYLIVPRNKISNLKPKFSTETFVSKAKSIQKQIKDVTSKLKHIGIEEENDVLATMENIKNKKSLSSYIVDAKEKDGNDEKIKNPFTAAYESTQGRGLAGFITSLNVNSIMEVPWETSEIGSKGPMLLKIDIGFSPIHDIPPGLDSEGMMRGPVYKVGNLMNQMFDDVYKGK